MGETVDGWNPALHQLIGWLVVYAMVFLRGLFPSQVVQDLLISSINRITGNHRHLVSWVEDLLQSNLACEERISLRRDVVGPKILRLQHVDKNPELGIRNMWIDDTSYFSVRYWLIIYKSEKVNGTWLHLHPSNCSPRFAPVSSSSSMPSSSASTGSCVHPELANTRKDIATSAHLRLSIHPLRCHLGKQFPEMEQLPWISSLRLKPWLGTAP